MRQPYVVVWSPEGRMVAKVQARNKRHACRLAPLPYRRFQGELYAETPEEYNNRVLANSDPELVANEEAAGPSSPETGAASDARGEEIA